MFFLAARGLFFDWSACKPGELKSVPTDVPSADRFFARGEERKASLLDINSESLQKCLKRELKSVLLMCSVLIAVCLDTQKVFSA